MKQSKIFIIFLILFGIFTSSIYAATPEHLCTNPNYYGLTNDEVNISNKEFYCWEIKYLKEYKDLLSTDINTYLSYYPTPLFVRDINILREYGITPEKAEYLLKYFIDLPIDNSKSDKSIIETALNEAENHMQKLTTYKIGRKFTLNLLEGITAYKSVFKYFALADCFTLTPNFTNNFQRYVNTYPKALRPIGVLGNNIINMFGEVLSTIDDGVLNDDIKPFINGGYKNILLSNGDKIASWNSSTCPLTNFKYDLKNGQSCISCHIFEITFNTISRVGYAIYDSLSYYSISLMVGLFLFWMLFVFFDNVIKKQDAMGFIKTFFNKVVFVFIVGFLLTISIGDKYNVLNYTIRPLTDFMVDYNEYATRDIEKSGYNFQCTYKSKDIGDSNVIFSKDIRENIVCTIERISAFNNMNYNIGKYSVINGWNQLLNLNFEGVIKIIIGILIMGIFFYINIMVPFYFIESFFMISIVVFLFPLILVGYAVDKKQFVKQSFDTFLSAIFQIISLTLMCSVISLLLGYISGLEFSKFQEILSTGDNQEIIGEVLYMLSFTPNTLLEIFYTGFICWFLLGKAISIANSYKPIVGSYNIAGKFMTFTKSIVSYTTTITREIVNLKYTSKLLSDKMKRKEEDAKLKSAKITKLANEDNKDVK